MFSGIVQAKGEIVAVEERGDDSSLLVTSSMFENEALYSLGDSIAVSGVCLTITELADAQARFDLASETRRATNLGTLAPRDVVNLERSLRVGDTIDGHFVQGHVDCTGEVLARSQEENTAKFEFSLPGIIAPLVVPKGSITINGVSLTVGEVSSERFSVYVIPHTLECTTFDALKKGDRVNFEADCLARYVEGILAKREIR